MSDSAIERRAKLRETLIDIAEAHVAKAGLSSLRARTLAAEAGCAVGAIYNVFDGLDGLVLAVNGRTFTRLGSSVAGQVAALADAPAADRLVTMAYGYLEFAEANPHLWRALFDVEMSTESNVPGWYLQELAKLFGIIAGPLAEIDPGASSDDINLRTRALFSAVHGIVLLGQEKRISAVPKDQLRAMLEHVVRRSAQPD